VALLGWNMQQACIVAFQAFCAYVAKALACEIKRF